ncbi:hypothetical protein [Nocardiopsis halotolerans]|uniref:hypothetical protein n=1 Tax=Nocardiopsis halotolerans TaxID=124252 RepID=UPI00034ACD76|nr:hypothetical protein [Nocardiopsis halotolerans]
MTRAVRRNGVVRRAVVAAGGCAALALAAGCAAPGNASPENGGAGATASPRPSDPHRTDEEAAALAAYTGMWDTVVAASHEGGEVPAELEDHAVDGALALMDAALEGARASGAEVTGEPVLDPSVVVEGPDRATVEDCLDDSDWNFGVGSSSGEGPRRVDATLIHDGLAWRVSDLRIWEAGSC